MITLPADVSNTKILTGPINNGTKQLIVYENKVGSSTSNLMILPVLCDDVSEIKFIDLSQGQDIFKKLEKFCKDHALNKSKGMTLSTESSKYIEVFDVGSYKASKVSNIQSLSNIDVDVFDKIPISFLSVLEKYYSTGFGFIICKLNKGTANYHPFAYTHDINGEELISHWDHSIYHFNSILNENKCKQITSNEALDELSIIFKTYFTDKDIQLNINKFNKMNIHGQFENMDISISCF